jgi:hypothetical protein
MATRLKTVQFAFPVLASLTNNTLTNLTQITVFLPESGTKTIKKAWVEITMDDIITATGGTVTTSTIDLRLGAAAYTSTTNAQTKANTGENISWQFTRDFTSHFTTNYTGTSMTCDLRLQINQSTGTTLGMVNVCAIVYVTYEYDDTSTTQIKTVYIPLNAPTASLPSTKTSHDTIPALDTYLPEASKTYRNISIVTQGNLAAANTTDFTVTYELSSLGTHTTGNYEMALLTPRWCRYIWDVTSYITTNVTHTFNVWANKVNTFHSLQAYMVVTYEFNASTTTSVMNSINLPMEIDSPFGGTSAADFQRTTREFWVEETNPVFQKLAFLMFWQNTAGVTGLNARIGTGSFVPYTQGTLSSSSGNIGLMIRNDSPTGISLARGRNTLQMDCYHTSTTARGGNLGGFWIVNYTSDVALDGIGSHNHTVLYPLFTQGTVTAEQQYITTAGAPSIPEANYFITSLGFSMNFMQGIAQQGVTIKAERLASGEGGLKFENVYSDMSANAAEIGVYTVFAQARTLFKRWTGDVDTERLDIETNRRYVVNSASAVTWLNDLIMSFTYHSITSTVSGNITNSNGGTVDISLHRAATGEKVLETSRVGNGAYSFTWYDNTEDLYVEAYEDNTYKGRSGIGGATLDT